MAKVSTNITIDADTKAKAQALLADLGLDLSTAVNIFLRQMIRENAIPFMISKNDPNAITVAAIEAIEKGDDVYGPFDSVSDAMEALDA